MRASEHVEVPVTSHVWWVDHLSGCSESRATSTCLLSPYSYRLDEVVTAIMPSNSPRSYMLP